MSDVLYGVYLNMGFKVKPSDLGSVHWYPVGGGGVPNSDLGLGVCAMNYD